jgi:hypothetical protein
MNEKGQMVTSNLPQEWKKLFQKAGISPKGMRNTNHN